MFCLLALIHFANAEEQKSWNEDFSFRGYWELRGNYSNVSGTPWNLIERVRPTLKYHPRDRIKIEATLNAGLTQGRYPLGEFIDFLKEPFSELLPPNLDGVKPTLSEVAEDCNWDMEPQRTIDEVTDVLALSRLFVDINTAKADYRIGRQALNWGSAQFFNPTDVFAQNLFAEPWQERAGVNALRINIPLGADALLTTVGATDDDFERYHGGFRLGLNRYATDGNLVMTTDGDTYMAGIDLKGDYHLGWWLEGGWFDTIETPFENGHLEFSFGVDYSFPVLERLTVMAQLSHDGSGEIPALYDWNARQDPDLILPSCDLYNIQTPDPPEEARQTLGRWYGISQMMLQVDEMWAINSLMLMNLADSTGVFFPSLAYRGDVITLNLGAQIIFGEDGEFRPPSSQTEQFGIDTSELIPTWTAMSWVRWNY